MERINNCAFRNVKAVHAKNQNIFTGSSTSTLYPPAITATVDKTLFVVFNSTTTNPTYTPPLNYNEIYDVYGNNAMSLQACYHYMFLDRDQTSSEMTTSISIANYGVSIGLVLEPVVNNPPTLSLTSPANNLVLSEGNVFNIQGSASDVDNGNVVTVKYKINNGTERALYSSVSDGSSPINFSKALTFSGDRLYDGATDVSGSLAEGTTHTLSVWAVDDQGGTSAVVTRSFTVHINLSPIITVNSYTPTQNGLIEPDTITLSGSASDPDGNTITVTGKINGGTQQTLLSGVTNGTWTYTFPISSLQTGDNTVTITATDQFGKATIKTFNLNKSEQKTPLLKSVARYKVIPPLGSAKEILAWLKREKGDLVVNAEASFVDAGQPESYIVATKSSVDLTTEIAEDEFVISVATAKPDIVFKQTFTRTDTNSTQAATSLVGVIS